MTILVKTGRMHYCVSPEELPLMGYQSGNLFNPTHRGFNEQLLFVQIKFLQSKDEVICHLFD